MSALQDSASAQASRKPVRPTSRRLSDFIQAIRDMNARMNIPDKIDKIQEKDIETIAKRACKEANPLYPVPRIMDLDDCIAIIHRLMP